MSIFKKLLGNQDAPAQKATPAGLQTMGAQLQRRFARGVQYNSKDQYTFRFLSLLCIYMYIVFIPMKVSEIKKKRHVLEKRVHPIS